MKRHYISCHPDSNLPFCALNSKERVSFVQTVEDNEYEIGSYEDIFSSDSESE